MREEGREEGREEIREEGVRKRVDRCQTFTTLHERPRRNPRQFHDSLHASVHV
jgi:hypothetical protein